MKNILIVLSILSAKLFATPEIDSSYFGSWYETNSGYYNRHYDPENSDEAIVINDTSVIQFQRVFDLNLDFHFKYKVLAPNKFMLVRPGEDSNIITFSRNKLLLKVASQKYVYERIPKGYTLYANPDGEDFKKLLLKNYKTKFHKSTSLSLSLCLSNCMLEIFNKPVAIDSIIKREYYGSFIGIPDANLFKVIVSFYPNMILSPKCALFFSELHGNIYLLNQNDIFFKPSGVDSFALDNKISFTDSNLIQTARLFSSYIIDSFPGFVYPSPPKKDTSSVEFKVGKSLMRSICGEELIRSPKIISDSNVSILTFFAMNKNYLYYYHIRLYSSNNIDMNKFKLGRAPRPFM